MAAALLASGEPAEWVQLFPMGKFGGRDGRGPYELKDAAHAAQVVAATRAIAGSAELPLDYDHQSDFAAVRGVGGRAPAAGWMKDFEVRADGIWAQVQWTSAAHDQLKAGEYRYLSPVFRHDKAGVVRAILRGGLTNSPNLDLAAVASQDIDHPQGKEMNLTAIASALALGEAATEADILGAITALQATASGLATVAQAAGLAADAVAGDIVTAVSAARSAGGATETIITMQAQLNELRAEVGADKAVAAVDAAIAAGKIIPAAREDFIALHSSDPERFASIVGKAPVLVGAGVTLRVKPETTADELDEQELAVASQLGLTEAEFKAAKQRDVA